MIWALELSKYIVTTCKKKDNPISNLKLQHILYYIQCYCVAKFNRKLFIDWMEAWQWGACVPDVYYYFCGYGARPITLEFKTEEYKSIYELDDKFLDDKFKDAIDFVIDEKLNISDWQLIKNIHKKGAWSSTFKNGEGYKKIIDFEKYYKYKKMKKDLDNL